MILDNKCCGLTFYMLNAVIIGVNFLFYFYLSMN